MKKFQGRRQQILRPKHCSFKYKLLTDNAWVWGRSIAGTVCSNTVGVMNSLNCECCVLSSRGLCTGLITRSEESYECGVSECDKGHHRVVGEGKDYLEVFAQTFRTSHLFACLPETMFHIIKLWTLCLYFYAINIH